ncbi:hypothetical protein FISHEDRAFT_72902 [Fistulina hepatica ATCC 64428]|nr:hypothetical protein FISHEDRAFT_72902 [Fistulina hepatica ATCC 64428]
MKLPSCIRTHLSSTHKFKSSHRDTDADVKCCLKDNQLEHVKRAVKKVKFGRWRVRFEIREDERMDVDAILAYDSNDEQPVAATDDTDVTMADPDGCPVKRTSPDIHQEIVSAHAVKAIPEENASTSTQDPPAFLACQAPIQNSSLVTVETPVRLQQPTPTPEWFEVPSPLCLASPSVAEQQTTSIVQLPTLAPSPCVDSCAPVHLPTPPPEYELWQTLESVRMGSHQHSVPEFPTLAASSVSSPASEEPSFVSPLNEPINIVAPQPRRPLTIRIPAHPVRDDVSVRPRESTPYPECIDEFCLPSIVAPSFDAFDGTQNKEVSPTVHDHTNEGDICQSSMATSDPQLMKLMQTIDRTMGVLTDRERERALRRRRILQARKERQKAALVRAAAVATEVDARAVSPHQAERLVIRIDKSAVERCIAKRRANEAANDVLSELLAKMDLAANDCDRDPIDELSLCMRNATLNEAPRTVGPARTGRHNRLNQLKPYSRPALVCA